MKQPTTREVLVRIENDIQWLKRLNVPVYGLLILEFIKFLLGVVR